MTLYLDTSLVITALTNEARTVDIARWLAARSSGECAISPWVSTEVSAALGMKLRMGRLLPQERSAALAMYRRLATRSFELLPVKAEHFGMAEAFADNPDCGLRASDALHLAIASGYGACLCTLDRRLAEAGVALGVSTQLL